MKQSSNQSLIGIVCAMRWELRRFLRKARARRADFKNYEINNPRFKILIQTCGIGENNARKSVLELISKAGSGKFDLMLSTGFAGALKENIKAGDLLIDTKISDPAAVEKFKGLAEKKCLPCHSGELITLEYTLSSAVEKVRLSKETSALGVEMESKIIQGVCAEKKIKFCSLRAASDELYQSLPPLVRELNSDGRVDVRFIKKLIFRPAQWLEFFKLARSSKKAEKSLESILSAFFTDR